MREPGAVPEAIIGQLDPGPLAGLAPLFVSPWSIVAEAFFHEGDLAALPPARHCNACPFLERGQA